MACSLKNMYLLTLHWLSLKTLRKTPEDIRSWLKRYTTLVKAPCIFLPSFNSPAGFRELCFCKASKTSSVVLPLVLFLDDQFYKCPWIISSFISKSFRGQRLMVSNIRLSASLPECLVKIKMSDKSKVALTGKGNGPQHSNFLREPREGESRTARQMVVAFCLKC